MKTAVLAVAVLMMLASVPAHASVQQAPASGLFFDHLVIVVMENHSLSDITKSATPYEASLPLNGSQALSYGYCSTYGSLPNYLCLTSGQTLVGNCDNPPVICGRFNATNIVDLLTGVGLTWKGYMEGMTSPNICSGGGSTDGGTNYSSHHDPFVYYNDIINNATRCQQVVPAGNYGGVTSCSATLQHNVASTLIDDLDNLSTVSNFMWLTPNNYDNTHDCPLMVGDTYLRTLVPQILETATFTQTRSALLVTYDEGHDASTTEPLFMVLLGSTPESHYNSTITYNHYSTLHTIEANWGLPSLTQNDATANVMSEFFGGGPVGGHGLNAETQFLPPYIIIASMIAITGLTCFYLRRKRKE